MEDTTKRQELFDTNKYEKINYNCFCEVIATARDCLSKEYIKRYGGFSVECFESLPEDIADLKEITDGEIFEIIHHLNKSLKILGEYLPTDIERLESAIND